MFAKSANCCRQISTVQLFLIHVPMQTPGQLGMRVYGEVHGD